MDFNFILTCTREPEWFPSHVKINAYQRVIAGYLVHANEVSGELHVTYRTWLLFIQFRALCFPNVSEVRHYSSKRDASTVGKFIKIVNIEL